MNKEKKIWDMLMKEVGNSYGVAGLMGNLMAESSLNPVCKTGGKGDIRKLSGSEYAKQVMSGKIAPYDFAHDGVAFGLVQWCYYSRKEGLFKFIREKKLDISSYEAQVKYILVEIKKYKTVWRTLQEAKSIEEASDIVMLRYEKPANTSDNAKAKRALYARQYYSKYAENQHLTIPKMVDILEDIEANEQLQTERHDMLLLVITELSDMAKGE